MPTLVRLRGLEKRFPARARGFEVHALDPIDLCVAPEEVVALVQEGDTITIDAPRRLLQLEVTDEELARRRKGWRPRTGGPTRGVLAKYAKLVSSASVGAVTDSEEAG